jgi:hypothetical protein
MIKNNKPNWIVIHHTGGTAGDILADTSHHTFEIVNNWHKQLWNFKSSIGFYIGYHYFIDKLGGLSQGRDDLEEGAHCIGLNTQSIGICLAGNFDRFKQMENSQPTEAQKETLRKLLKILMDRYKIPAKRIAPHRYFANKTCYGRNLPKDWARDLVIESEREKLKQRISLTEKILAISIKLFRLFKLIKASRGKKVAGVINFREA